MPQWQQQQHDNHKNNNNNINNNSKPPFIGGTLFYSIQFNHTNYK